MIKIDSLFFGYSQHMYLVKDLSLALQPGSITGLLGKNGAGKTTLLKLVSGLLCPLAGKISVLSHEPFKRQPSFLRQVFFVPEEFHLPSISIKRYIAAN